jgi:hypothetical protein
MAGGAITSFMSVCAAAAAAMERGRAVQKYLVEKGADRPGAELRQAQELTRNSRHYTGLVGKQRLKVLLGDEREWNTKENAALVGRHEDYPDAPPNKAHVVFKVDRIDPAWEDEHGIFRSGHVDEFAITCPDLGDLTQLELWVGNRQFNYLEGHNLQTSRWKVDKVVVTCLQHGKTAGGSGYSQLHPHGKGDHAIRSVKTSDSDQWHFIPSRKWLSCDGGDNLLLINEEIKRARCVTLGRPHSISTE